MISSIFNFLEATNNLGNEITTTGQKNRYKKFAVVSVLELRVTKLEEEAKRDPAVHTAIAVAVNVLAIGSLI